VLATATTGPDGEARFTKIPTALAPFIVTATYRGRTEEKLTGPGEASINIPAIASGVLIDAWIVFAAIGLLAAAIATLLVARAVSRRRGR
jgi:hypothetical protein